MFKEQAQQGATIGELVTVLVPVNKPGFVKLSTSKTIVEIKIKIKK